MPETRQMGTFSNQNRLLWYQIDKMTQDLGFQNLASFRQIGFKISNFGKVAKMPETRQMGTLSNQNRLLWYQIDKMFGTQDLGFQRVYSDKSVKFQILPIFATC